MHVQTIVFCFLLSWMWLTQCGEGQPASKEAIRAHISSKGARSI